MKICYLKHSNGLYYDSIYNSYVKSDKFKIVDHDDIVNNRYEALIMGPGFLSDSGLDRHENIKFNTDDSIIKVLYLNKEYKNLERKLNFINKNKIDIVLTVHHKYKEWNKKCQFSKFHKIPFSFDRDLFKDYKEEKIYDIGFTGNLFNKGVHRETDIMGPNFNNVRERIFNLLKSSKKLEKYSKILGENVYLKGEEYGRTINSAKIWISTPSAIDLIGTRYYEVMGTGTLLFCKMLPEIYDDLFEEGKHFLGFEDDLSDFEDKLVEYLEDERKRKKLAKSGYDHVRKNHTWENRVNAVYKIIKEHKD